MPHDFAEYEPELEPQVSSARGGAPPRKFTGIGVLDPPRPPKRALGPNPLRTRKLTLAHCGRGAACRHSGHYDLPAFCRALSD